MWLILSALIFFIKLKTGNIRGYVREKNTKIMWKEIGRETGEGN